MRSAKCTTWLLLATLLAFVNADNLSIKYIWPQMDYDFPTPEMREAYTASGDFIPRDILPSGIATWKDKMFVTVARWRRGVPSTLNYVPLSPSNNDKSPKLVPYPSWEANDINSKSNETLVSIFRVRVDECDRLWGIDMGLADVLGHFDVVRPKPRIVVIDLKTDKIIRIHTIEESVRGLPNYVNLVVDADKNACDKTHAYIADINDPKLLVYSFEEDRTWSFRHPYFSFEPLSTTQKVSGFTFHWIDAIFGLALTPPNVNGSKQLYFHAFAAENEYRVSTDVLKNKNLIHGDYHNLFTYVGHKGFNTQGTSSVLDPVTGVVYFTQINRHGLACWDSHTVMRPWTFKLLVSHPERMSFPCDVNMNTDSREVYVLQSNVPKLMYGKLTDDRIIIYSVSADSLTQFCSTSWSYNSRVNYYPNHHHSG